jgi:F0F1-type ATP synthase assembly protein I
MKPDNNPVPVYLTATGAAAEVGCLIIASAGGAVLLGLLLDQVLETKHLFLFLLLLASIPLNLWMIYRYILYKSRRLQASSRTLKEDSSSDD